MCHFFLLLSSILLSFLFKVARLLLTLNCTLPTSMCLTSRPLSFFYWLTNFLSLTGLIELKRVSVCPFWMENKFLTDYLLSSVFLSSNFFLASTIAVFGRILGGVYFLNGLDIDIDIDADLSLLFPFLAICILSFSSSSGSEIFLNSL